MKDSRESKSQTQDDSFQSVEQAQAQFDQAFGDLAKKMIKQGMSPKDAMGLNANALENLYAQAYRLYNTGKYIEAAHLFRILIMMNVAEPKYVLGLAACFHMLKEYENAIQAYTMCSVIDPKNPIPHYHSSDCFIQMKEYLSALVCLDMAIKVAGDKPEYMKMKERAQMSWKSLKEQLESTPVPGISNEEIAKINLESESPEEDSFLF